jgi:hypothetical protein
MPKLTILAAALPLAFASCGNLKYIVKEYHGVKVVTHAAPQATVRIFDKPAQQKMMVTPTIGKAMGMGAASGATFGLWTLGSDPFPLQGAAQNYLDVTGRRNLRITQGRLLVKPQWEFEYHPTTLAR